MSNFFRTKLNRKFEIFKNKKNKIFIKVIYFTEKIELLIEFVLID